MNIIVFGAGGFAKEVIDLIEENSKGKIVGFIDKKLTNKKLFNYKYLTSDQEINAIIKKYNVTHFFVAIGDIEKRTKIYQRIKEILKPLTIISKKAYVSKYSIIGDHVIIYPGVVINADVKIGNNVVINTNASIAHEVIIGNNININPGSNIAGKVTIEDFSTVGIGASIREKIKIATNTFIGAGAVVVKNTKSDRIFVGIPARILENEKI